MHTTLIASIHKNHKICDIEMCHLQNVCRDTVYYYGLVQLVNIFKGFYRSHDCLFLCLRSYSEKLEEIIPTFCKIRYILEELYICSCYVNHKLAYNLY